MNLKIEQKRQRQRPFVKQVSSTKRSIRSLVLILSALLFPVTMFYFSPALVFKGARLSILTGSYITFALLFLVALFFGRKWCAWFCPSGGISEIVHSARQQPFRQNRLKKIKYIIWVLWLAAVTSVVIFVSHGFSSIDPFFETEKGISIHNIQLMAVYYVVVGTIVISAIAFGRRGFCHTLCWMAPFMVLGRKVSNALNIKSMRLTTNQVDCTACGQCERSCPMSLPVKQMIITEQMEHIDCILCGSCVTACPTQKLSIKMQKPKL